MSIMRKFCYRCMKANCLCAQVIQLNNKYEVIILQHSDEMKHPKNTAQLLHLSLKKSQIIRGKNFTEEIKELLTNKKFVLVFPNIDQSPLFERKSESDQIDGLILLDGTWKKAKKIYYQSQELQKLPKMHILTKSNEYNIRKSPSENALSTYEAGVYALEQLGETNVDRIKPLFTSFIEKSIDSINKNKKEKLNTD